VADSEIRVLLVDDEEDLIEYLGKRLRHEGFVVGMATSGQAALDLAAADDFDVAVVDLKMPGMDGIETQAKLKEIRPMLQTIVLTGHGSIDAALQSGKQNAFRFLAKPANHKELVETIRAAAEKRTLDMQRAFRDEMVEVTAAAGSPREILEAVENLKKKYGMK
jgi:DNA-binding NtrC family response regulator